MLQRSRTLLAMTAFLTITALAVTTEAGERSHRQHVVKRINVRTHIHIDNRRTTVNIDRNRRNRVHRSIDTYSGDVAVYYRRGVGTLSYGTVTAPGDTLTVQPNAKIINVDRLGGKGECSMEQGVCVIRP